MVILELASAARSMADRTTEAVRSWPFRLTMLIMVAVLLVGAFLIALVSRWRKKAGSAGTSANEQLAQFRTLYEQGEISEEEFRRLRSLLGGQIRSELAVGGRETEKKPDRPPRQSAGDAQDQPEPPQDRIRPDEPS